MPQENISFFSGRHAGLSVWVLTQQLTSIAKPFRDNVACVVAFHNPSQIGMKSLFEEFGGDLDSQTRKNLTKNLKSENYSALCFSLRNPYHCYLRIPSPEERQSLKARSEALSSQDRSKALRSKIII